MYWRDGRRRAAQLAAGGGEAAGVEDGDEGGQLVEAVHRFFHIMED